MDIYGKSLKSLRKSHFHQDSVILGPKNEMTIGG